MAGSGQGEVTGGTEDAREVVACAERTLGAASARIETQPGRRPPPGWQQPDFGRFGGPGIGFRVLMRVLGALLYPISWIDRRRSEYPVIGAGVIEPAQGRYMIDRGRYAIVFADGKVSFGRSGQRVRRSAAVPGEIFLEPVLWLLRLLLNATGARPEGSETLRGTVCQKLAAHLDVSASAATNAGLRSTEADRFEDLDVLPVTVWIDGQHVRRIEIQEPLPPSQRRGSTFSPILQTLELWEFGVPVDGLDWSRLPSFRSRGHA